MHLATLPEYAAGSRCVCDCRLWYFRFLADQVTCSDDITPPVASVGVARLIVHAGQSILLLSVTPAVGVLIDLIKSVVDNVRKSLK